MNIQENYSLKNHNTFGVEVSAKYFAEVKSLEELNQALKHSKTQRTKYKKLKPKSTTKVTKAEGTLKRLKVKIRTVSLFLSLKNSKKLKRDRTFVTFVVQ